MERSHQTSGRPATPADFNRNGRPASIGTGGRHQSECPAGIIGIRNRHGSVEPQGAGVAAAQADVGGDHLGFDQGHVIDEQTQDPFALAGLDAGIIPNRRELVGQVKDSLTSLRVERGDAVPAAPLIIGERISMQTQFLVPFCLESSPRRALLSCPPRMRAFKICNSASLIVPLRPSSRRSRRSRRTCRDHNR